MNRSTKVVKCDRTTQTGRTRVGVIALPKLVEYKRGNTKYANKCDSETPTLFSRFLAVTNLPESN